MRNAWSLNILVLLAPAIASAQTLQPFATLLQNALNLTNQFVIPLLMAAAVAFFFWGLIEYIRKRDDESRKILWVGLGALLIMFALYGILYLLGSALNINSQGTLRTPVVHAL